MFHCVVNYVCVIALIVADVELKCDPYYRVSQKKVSAFGGVWNKKYVTDIQN